MIWVLTLAATLAVVYAATLLRARPSMSRTVLKTAPVAVLALGAWAAGGPALLVAALALSALGDACLSRDGERWFLAGLTAFLLAQLAYIPLLWSGWPDEPLRLAGMAGAAVFAFAMARWLWPHLGPLRPAVAVYMAVILTMGAAAMTAAPVLIAGAVLFAASDAVLAAETFVWRAAPRRWTAPAIWSTYFAAQALLAVGLT